MRIERPHRVAHSHTQQLNGPVADVFPLLCPVREADWIEGWDPVVVLTESGIAEQDCVFVTGAGADEAVWTVTQYEPRAGRIEFIKVTPGTTVARIHIQLREAGAGRSTAEISYQHTSIGPAGDAAVAAFTADHYRAFMETWERRLNHYLATGRMLDTATP